MEEKRTEINEIGEFGLIERITAGWPQYQGSTRNGVGDDAAVIWAGDDCLLLSTDMLIEGIHFDLRYHPLSHLGYKAVAVNISDIAAMNGVPQQITVSIGLTNRFSVEAVEELYKGIRSACDTYRVDLVGGDTTASASGLVLSVTVAGRISPERLALRSGMRLNDILCVTGDLGGAYLGLQVLEREKEVYLADPEMQPQLDRYEYLIGRQLKPEARTDIVHEFNELGIVPRAMIDISDGLASELMHLGHRSGLGVMIYEDKIPIDRQSYETALEFGIDPITAALHGGEDYELLFAIDAETYEKLRKHADIPFIGHTTPEAEGFRLRSKAGQVVELKAQGWNHFRDGA